MIRIRVRMSGGGMKLPTGRRLPLYNNILREKSLLSDSYNGFCQSYHEIFYRAVVFLDKNILFISGGY
jgi:hypothetical protein